MTIIKLTKEGTKTSNAIHDINIQLNLGLTQEQEKTTSLKDLGFTSGYYDSLKHELQLF